MVEGKKTGDWYAPFQGKKRMLARTEPVINSPVDLFPGKYTVKIYVQGKEKTLGAAEVKAGTKTVLKR
jgi:hypothetical protein